MTHNLSSERGPLAWAATLALIPLLVPVAQANPTSERLVIEAGRVIQDAKTEIVDGVIVIEGGRIVAVGPRGEVDTPWDAPVIGGPEFVAFPGFVEAHSSSGMDRANENLDVAPFLDVRDSIDPINVYFEDCRRWGITTVNIQQGNNCVIGGQGRIVRPVGITIEEMTIRPHFGIKLSASPKSGKSRATQAQALRRAFIDLRLYLEGLVQDKRDGGDRARREALFQGRELEGEKALGRAMAGSAWRVDGLELIPRGAIDEKQAPLLDLVEGRGKAFFWAGSPREVHLALEVARTNGFLDRTTLVIHPSCWKVAELIAESGVAVVLEGPLVHIERDPETGDETETFVPGVLHEKGVRFALSSQNSSSQSLWFQAARAIGLGLDRQVALDAVTRVPAEILGMGKDVGSLHEGRMGNVLLLSGDPLANDAWVEEVVIEGQRVYDRRTDIRNRYIFDGVEPIGVEGAAQGR